MKRCDIVKANLGPQFEARLKERGLLSRRDGIVRRTRENTEDFARRLLADEPLSPADAARLLDEIKNEAIDVNATMEFIDHAFSGNNKLSMPLHMLMLAYVKGSEDNLRLFSAVLGRVDDINCPYDREGNQLSLRQLYLYEKQDAFVNLYLNHPGVDIEHPIYGGDGSKFTLLNECLKGICGGGPSISEAAARYYAPLLFDRGAIASQQMLMEGSEELSAWTAHGFNKLNGFLRPYLGQWQQEWDYFTHGCLRPEEVTPLHLGHFYSLGHLEEALQPSRWVGHEASALALHDQLPSWVRREAPCQDVRHMLAARMQPDTKIIGWSASLGEQIQQKHRFSR